MLYYVSSDDGAFYLDLKNGTGSFGKGDAPSGSDTTMIMKGDDFVKMFTGKINPTSAFMTGKLKIKGDLAVAMKLESLMKKAQAKLWDGNSMSVMSGYLVFLIKRVARWWWNLWINNL